MVRFIEIHDVNDARIADYTRLTDVDYRLMTEGPRGVFMAEGELVIRRALDAGHVMKSALMSSAKVQPFANAFDELDVIVYLASDELLGSVTGFHVHRGALAAFHRPPPRSLLEVCSRSRFVMVLEDLVDHTNVGAIFRSATALGCGGIVISPRCADPLYRRALKVSMGATAMVPWTRATTWPSALAELTEMGFTTIGLTPAGDTDISRLAGVARPALVVGTEGHGLSIGALAACEVKAVIPMANDIDSLNVAAASAIACYAVQLP